MADGKVVKMSTKMDVPLGEFHFSRTSEGLNGSCQLRVPSVFVCL